MKNQRARSGVGHFSFRHFPHAFGISVPPRGTSMSCPRRTWKGPVYDTRIGRSKLETRLPARHRRKRRDADGQTSGGFHLLAAFRVAGPKALAEAFIIHNGVDHLMIRRLRASADLRPRRSGREAGAFIAGHNTAPAEIAAQYQWRQSINQRLGTDGEDDPHHLQPHREAERVELNNSARTRSRPCRRASSRASARSSLPATQAARREFGDARHAWEVDHAAASARTPSSRCRLSREAVIGSGMWRAPGAEASAFSHAYEEGNRSMRQRRADDSPAALPPTLSRSARRRTRLNHTSLSLKVVRLDQSTIPRPRARRYQYEA
jgi:hypothetical protein